MSDDNVRLNMAGYPEGRNSRIPQVGEVVIQTSVKKANNVMSTSSPVLPYTDPAPIVQASEVPPPQTQIDIVEGEQVTINKWEVSTEKRPEYTRDLEAEDESPLYLTELVSIPKGGRARLHISLETGSDSYIDKFFSKFILESVSFSSSEKAQITETLDEYIVSFRGSQPTMLEMRGSLLNDYNNDWLTDFIKFYDAYRASSVSQRSDVKNRLVSVLFENFQFSGYLYSFGVSMQAMMSTRVPFTLVMLVSNRHMSKARDFTQWQTTPLVLSAEILRKLQDWDQKWGTNFVDTISRDRDIQVDTGDIA